MITIQQITRIVPSVSTLLLTLRTLKRSRWVTLPRISADIASANTFAARVM